MVDAATRPGLGGDIAATTGGAIKGAAKATVEPIDFGHYGVKIPVPAPLASAGAGGLAAHYAGLPTEVGSVTGAAIPIIKGGIKGAREALAARAEASRAAMTRGVESPPPIAPPETAPTPLPIERQIAAPTAIVTEPPADTSGIIKGWQPTILENENAPAQPLQTGAPPTPSIATHPDLLDGLAQGYGYKNFAAIKGPSAIKTINDIATKIQIDEELAARRASSPTTAPAPEGLSVAVTPGTDVIDKLPDARMPPVQPGAPQPVSQAPNLPPPTLPATAEASPTVPPWWRRKLPRLFLLLSLPLPLPLPSPSLPPKGVRSAQR